MIIYLIIILISINYYLIVSRKENPLEIIALGIIISLGLLGTVTFLLTEFGNQNYYFSLQLTLAFLAMIFPLLAIRNKEKLSSLLKLMLPSSISDRIVLLLSIILILRGVVLPLQGWDAYALYDARAIMYLDGLKQSDLIAPGQYDATSVYYYFAYPPMTSVLHATAYSLGFATPMVVHGLFYVGLMILIYLLIQRLYIGRTIKIALFIISALHPLIVSQTTIAYTNLPLITFQLAAIYCLLKYFTNNNSSYFYISGIFLAFSNWTRVLEPIYMGILVLAVLVVFLKKEVTLRMKIIQIVVYSLVGISTRIFWFNYLDAILPSSPFSTPSFLSIFQSVLNSINIANIIDVVFYIYSSLLPIMIYLVIFMVLTVIYIFRLINKLSKTTIMIYLLCLLILAIIFGGTLYYSSLYDWWDDIPGSLLRSSVLLVPLLTLLLGYTLNDINSKKNV